MSIYSANKAKDKVVYLETFLDDFENLTGEEIQLLIIYFYARKGYAFKAPAISDKFNLCIRYIPNPNLKMEGFELSENEQILIELLNTERESQKNQ